MLTKISKKRRSNHKGCNATPFWKLFFCAGKLPDVLYWNITFQVGRQLLGHIIIKPKCDGTAFLFDSN